MDQEFSILHAFYDFEVSPNSFDFAAFLICAETKRRTVEADGLHIIVVPQASKDGHHDNTLFDSDHSGWRLHNIAIPLTQMLPSCRSITVCAAREQAAELAKDLTGPVFPETYSVSAPVARHHTGWTIIDAHLGHDLQYFRATQQARRYARQWIHNHAGGKKCVAITLREAPFVEIRNSNLDVWGEFAQRLTQDGYFPVILRDIDTALADLPPQFEGMAVFPEGVFNLLLRMAFYEECDLCAFVANGPGQVCFYSKNVRFIYLVTGDWLERKPTPFGRIGINFGETPPLAHEFQRWIWKEQNADILLEELKSLEADIEEAKANGSYDSKLAPLPENRLPLSQITERFFEWADRAYGSIQEQTELAEACLALLEPESAPPGSELSDDDLEKYRLSKLLNIALGSKNLGKAVSILEVIGEKFGHTQQQIVQLGVIHEAMAKMEEAISFYEQALEMDPAATDLHFRVGVASKYFGNLAKARHHFETLMESGSSYPDLYSELGDLYEQLDMADLALKCYEIGEKRGALNLDAQNRKIALSNPI